MIENSYIDNYLKELKEQGKTNSYIATINTTFYKIAKSGCESIQDFESWLKGNYNNYNTNYNTLRNDMSQARAFFKWLEGEGVEVLEQKEEKNTMTESEQTTLKRKRIITVAITSELHMKLSILSSAKSKSMSAIVVDALNAYCETPESKEVFQNIVLR